MKDASSAAYTGKTLRVALGNWNPEMGAVIIHNAKEADGKFSLTNADYALKQGTGENENHLVLARPSYTVTFDLNGKTGTAPAEQSIERNSTAIKPADPTAEGFVFTGWFTDKTCETAYDFAAPITAPIILYAGWVEDTIQSIAVTAPPTKTEYTYGDTFDKSGMVVIATYLSGKTADVTGYVTIAPETLTVVTTEVTISYQGKTATQSVTVNPKVVTEPTFKLPDTLIYYYTGQEICPEVQVFDGETLILSNEYTVTYANNIQVGSGKVIITDNSGGNYDVSGETTFAILHANLSDVSVKQAGTLTYTGSAQTPTVNASATTVDGAAVTFTYCLTQDGTYSTELPAFTDAGTYTVWFKANAANHKETGGSFAVVVEKAQNEWVIEPSIQGWTYGDFGNEPTAKAKFGTGVEFNYKKAGNELWDASPDGAGIYELRARVRASDNWELLDTTIEFEIEKATPTADIFDFTPPANLNACDGLAKEATVTAKEGIVGVGSITVKYFKDGSELDGAPTTAGTYTVKIDAAEGANFFAADDLTVGTFTFDITDAADHTNVVFRTNNDGTHDKVCTVCQAVLADNEVCAYEEQVQNPNAVDLIASPATCISGTTYYKSCNCGHKSSETFADGVPNRENHTETGTKLEPNGNGTHNEVRICCKAVVNENVACTPTLADDTCLTAEICICGYVIKAAATEHSFTVPVMDSTDHWNKCSNCEAIDEKIGHNAAEDGDCTTEEKCSCGIVMIPAKDKHSFDNACDTTCNNAGCKHTRVTHHEPLLDDGDCTTPIRCAVCQEITTEAKEHSFDNTCDTTCNNKDCKYTRTITHTPGADDGNCETAVHCKICDAIVTPAKSHSFTNACDTTCNNAGCKHTRVTHHEPLPDDGNCTTPIRCVICQEITTEAKEHSFDNTCDTTCNNKDCKYTRTITHTPNEDDGDCETAIHCKICDAITTPAKSHSFTNACDTDCNNAGCKHTRTTEHRPEVDDGDCTTDILCSICDAVTTKGNASHTGGTATCTAKAECTVCGTKYGEMLDHTFTVLQNDSTDHWNKCKDCDAIDAKMKHTGDDDGDCTTEVKCSCGWVLVAAKAHSFDNACDPDCNNPGCEYTVTIRHTPAEDDGNCLTEIRCIICNAITTQARDAHTGGTATCTAKAKCEVCDTEYGEMLEHSFTVPQSDDADHWNKCKDCDAIDNKMKHTGDDDGDCTTAVKCTCGYVLVKATAGHTGGTATCTAKAKCEVCDTEYGETDSNNHAYSSTWTQTADEHYYECARCHEKKDKAAHGYTNACDTDCNTCGYVRSITHDHTEKFNDTEHWMECTVCGDKKDAGKHAFDNACDTSCSGCAYTRTITHDYAEKFNDTEHWLECTVCGDKKDAGKHAFDNACDTSCSGCAYTRTITHDYAEKFNDTEHWMECTVCGDKTDAGKHAFDNACDTSCSGCAYIRTITHKHTVLEHDAAHHWYVCSVCGDVKDESKAPHSGGGANCMELAVCSLCGISYGELAPDVHHLSTSTFTDNGDGKNHTQKRDCCGEEEIQPHSYGGDNVCDQCGFAKVYTITFNPNRGRVEPTSGKTGSDWTLDKLPTPKRTNHSFDGWFTSKRGGTRVTTETKFTEDTTIYAHWTYYGPDGNPKTGDPTAAVTCMAFAMIGLMSLAAAVVRKKRSGTGK